MASSTSRSHIYDELLYGKLFLFLCDFEMKILRTKICYHNKIIVLKVNKLCINGHLLQWNHGFEGRFTHQMLFLFKLVSTHHQFMPKKATIVLINHNVGGHKNLNCGTWFSIATNNYSRLIAWCILQCIIATLWVLVKQML